MYIYLWDKGFDLVVCCGGLGQFPGCWFLVLGFSAAHGDEDVRIPAIRTETIDFKQQNISQFINTDQHFLNLSPWISTLTVIATGSCGVWFWRAVRQTMAGHSSSLPPKGRETWRTSLNIQDLSRLPDVHVLYSAPLRPHPIHTSCMNYSQ